MATKKDNYRLSVYLTESVQDKLKFICSQSKDSISRLICELITERYFKINEENNNETNK